MEGRLLASNRSITASAFDQHRGRSRPRTPATSLLGITSCGNREPACQLRCPLCGGPMLILERLTCSQLYFRSCPMWRDSRGMPLTRPERFSAFPASSIAPRPCVRTCLGRPVRSPDSFVAPVQHSGPLITQATTAKHGANGFPSRFDSRTRAFRKPKPNSIPISPTASAANASGSVQTTLSKLPRATHSRTIRRFLSGQSR